MARPHIEFIQMQDITWQTAALADGMQPVPHKKLSHDADNGAFTAMVRLANGWQVAGARAYKAAQELYVLAGQLALTANNEEFLLKPGGYLHIAARTPLGPLKAASGTEILWMADARLNKASAGSPPGEGVTFTDSAALEWETPWVTGPEPGLRIKLLWRDETSGAYTRLIAADPEWTEERLEHHECIEEVYVLEGDMTMGDLGTMTAGGYIWRPPMIKHGPMHTPSGGVMFIRTDGPLENFYTDVAGRPLNY